MAMHSWPVRSLGAVVVLLFATIAYSQPLAIPSLDGRKHVTAVRTDRPITVDGVLDEAVWAQAPPAADFIQADAIEGQPAHYALRSERATSPSPPNNTPSIIMVLNSVVWRK